MNKILIEQGVLPKPIAPWDESAWAYYVPLMDAARCWLFVTKNRARLARNLRLEHTLSTLFQRRAAATP